MDIFQTIKIIVAVLGVLGLTYGATVLMGRLAGARRSTEHLGVLTSMQLGSGSRVAVVKVGRQMYILGITDEQVTRIGTVDDPDEMALFEAEPKADGLQFDEIFERMRGGDPAGS